MEVLTLLDAKGHPRDSELNTSGLHLQTDFSDDSNPGEGAVTEETFPQGVPMPPTRNLPAEFECQLCFKAKKFQKPSDWTKHVHEDVQPFTCTYDKCKEPKSFKRKADWVRHENERHRHLEWWICQVDDCRHPCYRKDNFLQQSCFANINYQSLSRRRRRPSKRLVGPNQSGSCLSGATTKL